MSQDTDRHVFTFPLVQLEPGKAEYCDVIYKLYSLRSFKDARGCMLLLRSKLSSMPPEISHAAYICSYDNLQATSFQLVYNTPASYNAGTRMHDITQIRMPQASMLQLDCDQLLTMCTRVSAQPFWLPNANIVIFAGAWGEQLPGPCHQLSCWPYDLNQLWP